MIPAIQAVIAGFGSPGNHSGETVENRDHSDPDAHPEQAPTDSRRALPDPPVRLETMDPRVGTLLDVLA